VFDINDELDYIVFPEGRILYNADDSTFNFEYHLRDHLGSVRVAFTPPLEGAGEAVVVQETSYYPFGAPIGDLSWSPKSTNRYLREGKEYISDFDFNKYDYSARYYDPYIVSFLNIDPMAGKYYGISPYAYCSNNPISRIDPDGMDDYSVNLKGQIELIKKTKDEMDRLIAFGKNNKIEYDDDGNMTNAFFDVNKGILDNQKKSGETTYMSIKGNEQAEGMFKFLSENTQVEWGKLSYGKSSNYISTNNATFDNGIETIAYDNFFSIGKANLIKSIDHNHPNLYYVESLPSGFPETPMFNKEDKGDKGFAEWLYKYYPNDALRIQLRVYRTNGQGYIRFDNKKIYYK
jgi:RHS repeat-associated protein